ncbi:fibrinogen-like protein 1 [Haliotis rufescens]|uniref:fibrinogen-like protein 1 n=1 Tax=Haliotis rufescens TaxID=6454 RepID=UPI001EB04EAD|nr:fibrinogen-like protein 1 [Haliotis rufescens]XP_048256770.1 fibrinogen-like protein 1 [Haliotis rufescens]
MLSFLLAVMIPGVASDIHFSYVETCYNPTLSPNTYHATQGPSVTACGILCARDDGCQSFSVKLEGGDVTCYLNADRRREDNGCGSRSYRHYNGYDSRCQYEGFFVNDTYGCRCFHGYIGKWCDRLMQDCSEGHTTDHYKGQRDVFYIHPNSSSVKYRVFCTMDYKGKTYFMRRSYDFSYVNFARSWEEYKHGFGDLQENGNFWAGLEMLHRVTTNRDHKLVVMASFQENTDVHWRQHFYNDFKTDGEANLYKFSYTSSSPNNWDVDDRELMDGLGSSIGIPFSTYDNDNSPDPANCPNISESGWWFKLCHEYNPTGQPRPLSLVTQTSDPTSLSWPHKENKAPVTMTIYIEID